MDENNKNIELIIAMFKKLQSMDIALLKGESGAVYDFTTPIDDVLMAQYLKYWNTPTQNREAVVDLTRYIVELEAVDIVSPLLEGAL